jgi:hypothetical protein
MPKSVMGTMATLKWRVSFAMVAVVLVAACTGTPGATTAPGDEATPASSGQAVCDALASLVMSVEGVRNLGENSTVTEIRSAVDTVGLALENLRTQAGELASSKVDALRTAIDGLRSAAQGLPEATSVTGAVLSLSEELDNVRTAASSLGTELGCASS